jgi:hypothetical protein
VSKNGTGKQKKEKVSPLTIPFIKRKKKYIHTHYIRIRKERGIRGEVIFAES